MVGDKLIWIDLEMTGLNPEVEGIIEIATIITDNALNIIAEGPNCVISQPRKLLDGMDEWNSKQHTSSGLLNAVNKSTTSLAAAEKMTLAFLREHVESNTAPMCGNTVWQDRRFLSKYMPQLEDFFHYRVIDVSTIKQLAYYWSLPTVHRVKKRLAHRALSDIRESIAELAYYKENTFTHHNNSSANGID